MSEITCTRIIEFDAAHRVKDISSKCRFLHGHRYRAECTFIAAELDNLGMVADFGIIKELLGGWIDTHWDHNVILFVKDMDLGLSIQNIITDQNIFYLPCNPTAENMALYLKNEVCPKLFVDYNITCQKIKLYETPNCFATSM